MAKPDFIKNNPHFKLVVPFKETIVLESALRGAAINYYREENPVLLSGTITYFIANNDRRKTDAIITDNKLNTGTQTIAVTDYPGMKKMYKVYIAITVALIILFAVFA